MIKHFLKMTKVQLNSTFRIVLLATFINQLGNIGIIFLVIFLNQKHFFSLSLSSICFAAFGLGMLLTSLLSGMLIDRYGELKCMVRSLFCTSLLFFILPFVYSYYCFLTLSFLLGLAYGFYRPASQAFVSKICLENNYKKTFVLYRFVINLGMSIGAMAGGYLASFSFDLVFFVNGLANLFASILLFFSLKKMYWLPTVSERKKNDFFSLSHHYWRFLPFLLGMLMATIIFFQHESTLAIYIARDLKLPLTFYGFLFMLNTLLIMLCELPLNMLMINWQYHTHFMLGIVFLTIGFVGLYFSFLSWHIILLSIIWTMGEMILYPAATSYVAQYSPLGYRGTYMSLFSTSSNLGMLLGPCLGALIMDRFGAGTLWLVCGLWGVLALAFFSRCRARQFRGTIKMDPAPKRGMTK